MEMRKHVYFSYEDWKCKHIGININPAREIVQTKHSHKYRPTTSSLAVDIDTMWEVLSIVKHTNEQAL